MNSRHTQNSSDNKKPVRGVDKQIHIHNVELRANYDIKTVRSCFIHTIENVVMFHNEGRRIERYYIYIQWLLTMPGPTTLIFK